MRSLEGLAWKRFHSCPWFTSKTCTIPRLQLQTIGLTQTLLDLRCPLVIPPRQCTTPPLVQVHRCRRSSSSPPIHCIRGLLHAGTAIKVPMEIVHGMATSTCPPCLVASKTSCGNTVTVGKRQPVDKTVRVGKKSKVTGIDCI